MRGRIRQLKPDLFLDDEFWALLCSRPELPLLQGFLGLLCQVDRDGRFEWRPAVLKTQVLPYWQGEFGVVLEALAQARIIVAYEVDGRRYGQVRTFSKHQRPNNREPESCIPQPLESAQAGGLALHEPPLLPAEAPRASQLPTPNPNSQPQSRGGAGGVSRVITMPGPEPDREYLDLAVMSAVSKERATATWKHYWGAGLPGDGVEKLRPWLVQRALEKATRDARVPSKGAPAGEEPVSPYLWAPTAEHRAFCAEHKLDVQWAGERYREAKGPDRAPSTIACNQDFMRRLRCWHATGKFIASGQLPKPPKSGEAAA